MPTLIQSAFQPLAAKPTIPGPQLARVPKAPVAIDPHPASVVAAPGPSKAELEAKREADFKTAQTARKEKQIAWVSFFNPEPSCDHPVDWKAQVDCGNYYVRAKQAFEGQWARAHGGSVENGDIVIDNHSFEKPKR